MFETRFNQDFNFNVSDSTILVNQGTARIGNTILPFRGASIQIDQIADFGDASNKYQYSTLLLHQTNSFADLTAVASLPQDSTTKLTYPVIITDSSNAYPIGLFTLYNNQDGTVSILNSSRVL